MTHFEKIKSGDTKTVGVELAEYAAALGGWFPGSDAGHNPNNEFIPFVEE